MPHHVQDEGFHEIQLNGKQLVFLFMAATVVSVVIFLCGVLVGRGVRAERGAETAAANSADTTPQPATAPPTPPPAGSDPTAAAAPPAAEDLSYFNRLEKSKGPAERLKPGGADRPAASTTVEKSSGGATPRPAAPPPEPVKTASAKDAAAPPKEPAPAKQIAAKDAAPPRDPPAAKDPSPAKEPAAKEPARAAAPPAGSAEPNGQGFAVQIAALNVRSEADAIARRLSSKGYSAYVISPASGTPVVYRVRVGKFPTRREAESVAARLQKEEQFKPWVTR